MPATLYDVVAAEGSPLPDWGGRSLAVESGGRLWACYKRSIGGFDEIAASYSDDNGVTWTEEIITNVNAVQDRPTIAIDSNDTVFVVWHGTSWGTNTGVNNIRFSRRVFGGNWTIALEITDSADAQQEPSIAIDSNDNVFFLWFGQGYGTFPTRTQLVSRKRLPGGSLLSIEEITDVSNILSPPQRDVSVAIDSNNDVHAVWSGGSSNTLLYAKRNSSWAAAVTLFSNSDDQRFPTIAIDSSDNLHVVWIDKTPDPIILYYIKKTSGVWGTELVLTSGKDASSPSIAVDLAGNLHLLYTWRKSGSVTSIYYLKKDNTGWATQEEIYTQPESQGPPHALFAIHPASTHILTLKSVFLFIRQDNSGIYVTYGTIEVEGFPTDALTRVTSIIHRYDRGIYNMEIGLGGVTSDLDIPATDTITDKSYNRKPPSEPSVSGLGISVQLPGEERIGATSTPLEPTITPFSSEIPIEPVFRNIWSHLTPWREEAGETFTSEVKERLRQLGNFFGSLFR